jgi:hypothetical protein
MQSAYLPPARGRCVEVSVRQHSVASPARDDRKASRFFGKVREVRTVLMRQLLVTMVVIGAGAVLLGCSKSAPEPSSSTEGEKSTSQAIQSAAANAAAPAPRAKPEDETCPPGAKCDGYCGPGQKQLANGAKCAACTARECAKPFYEGCSKSPDPKACEAIMECFHRTNCLKGGVTACYCGDEFVDACAAKGPTNSKCSSVMEAGFPNKGKGMSPKALIKAFGSPETAGGFATGIGLCITGFCAAECVPYCSPES